LNLGIIQQGTLTNLKLESVLLQRIIDAQRTNKGMKYIHEKMEAGKANWFKKDNQGVIWFKDRIVVPKDTKVHQQILDEAHLS
jgi:phosphomannomutase